MKITLDIDFDGTEEEFYHAAAYAQVSAAKQQRRLAEDASPTSEEEKQIVLGWLSARAQQLCIKGAEEEAKEAVTKQAREAIAAKFKKK